MIAGLETVSAGEIEINGRIVNDLPSRDRDIALVFQSYALYPHMTVAQNMSFGLKLRKVPKAEIEKAVREAARILDLETLLSRKPAQLSGGQRQRVALGRALVRNPAAFLMDEPLSNLDAKLRVQTRAEIAQLHHRLQATMLYVTHDQVEAMTMADRIAVMNLGVLEQYGSPRDLYNFPNNLFVAGFIGSPSMNFETMRVDPSSGGARLIPVSPTSGYAITLTDAQRAVVNGNVTGEVVVGVRPEHLAENSSSPESLSVTGTVDVVEFLGNDTHVHVSSGENKLVALMSASLNLKIGEQVKLYAPSDSVHLFDPETRLVLR
jgi:multiple sugar transport system ATP-binding protein